MNEDISIILVETDTDLRSLANLRMLDIAESRCHILTQDQVLKELESEDYNFWLATQGNQPIGYSFGTTVEGSYRSDGIYVMPNFRNKGVGLRLAETQVEFARELGCKDKFTSVAKDNGPSISLQRRLGFNFEPTEQGYLSRLEL